MSNGLLSPKVYANAGLSLVKNHLVMARLVNTDFKDEFKKKGNTVYVKRPPRFVAQDGATIVVQDVTEGEVAVTLDKQKHVAFEFTSAEDTLTVDGLLKSKTMDGAMSALAQQIDTDLHALTNKFPNWAGTPGQVVDSFNDFTKAPQRMDEIPIPQANRVALLNPADAWALLGSIAAAPGTNPQSVDALTKAKLPLLGNVDCYQSASGSPITCGTRTGGAVNGAAQNVTYDSVRSGDWTQTLLVKTLGNTKTVKAGESFAMAGCYAINLADKQAYSYLQQFTVISDATSDSGGLATLTVSPPMITSGAYQTVSAVPADSAAIVWMGDATTANSISTTYRPNAAFHRDAISLTFAKLTMPMSGEADYATDPDSGVTIRYWRFSDGINDVHTHRFDALYGVKAVDTRYGVRFSGTA